MFAPTSIVSYQGRVRSRFPKPRPVVLVNNIHLEPQSEKNYNLSTHVLKGANQPERIYEK